MNKRQNSKLPEAPLPSKYQVIYTKSKDKQFKNTLIIVISFWVGHELTHYLDKRISQLNIKYTKEPNVDMGQNWNMPQFDALVLYMQKFILSKKYDKVIILGQSAQGFAALLHSHKLSSKCPFVQFFSIPFNPNIELNPKVADELSKEYKDDPQTLKNVKYYRTYNILAKKLQTPKQNLFVYVVVGTLNKNDCFNAFRIRKCKYLA